MKSCLFYRNHAGPLNQVAAFQSSVHILSVPQSLKRYTTKNNNDKN